MRENRKKTIRTLLLIFILFLGLGFAALAANLKINGTLNVSRTAWDVHFENVAITEGSVTANPAPVSDNTTTTEMTYTINFTKPGDYFEFTTDIVNEGTIDAMVDVVSNNAYANASSTTPITLPTYLTSTVTYSDGVEIKPNQLLAHNTSEKIKVRVEFKTDIEVSDLPSSGNTSIVFKFIGDYKQADKNAVGNNTTYTPGQVVYYDPVTNNTCNSNEFDVNSINNGTSTCYKWRIIKVGDNRFEPKVAIQMDHNLVNKTTWCATSDCFYPGDALRTLENATSGWKDELKLTYSYDVSESVNNVGSEVAINNYGLLSCISGTCTVLGNTATTNLKARLITGEEVRALTLYAGAPSDSKAGTWKIGNSYDYVISRTDRVLGGDAFDTGDTSLSWLIENTSDDSYSNATPNAYGEYNYGYWTITPAYRYTNDRANYPYFVSQNGWLQGLSKYESGWGGVRPVIEIEKSKLN